MLARKRSGVVGSALATNQLTAHYEADDRPRIPHRGGERVMLGTLTLTHVIFHKL
jgi:hypothetical protein